MKTFPTEMLAYYVTFDAAWMSATGVFTWPQFELFFFGAILSLAGLGIGAFAAFLRKRSGK